MNRFLKLFLKFLKNRFESPATKQTYADMLANLQTKDNTLTETISLVRTLQNQGVAKTTTVKHNSLGDLSIGGWLNYFNRALWP